MRNDIDERDDVPSHAVVDLSVGLLLTALVCAVFGAMSLWPVPTGASDAPPRPVDVGAKVATVDAR